MASILDRYGIKEVSDVTFYEIDENGKPAAPVLYLDTLKVSTIEQTADNTSARGGKGNPELIVWDYGKEITLNIEDALFSMKSMAIMYGALDKDGKPNIDTTVTTLKRTARKDQVKNGKVEIHNTEVPVGENAKYYDEKGQEVAAESGNAPAEYAYVTFDITGKNVQQIEISAETFPGTYYVTGDTYARNEVTGKDEFFQFIVHKAKMLSEVTLTMEAEGDPSTFSMQMKVLRPKDGKMMKLVKYDI